VVDRFAEIVSRYGPDARTPNSGDWYQGRRYAWLAVVSPTGFEPALPP
jgi:hypothetical protein